MTKFKIRAAVVGAVLALVWMTPAFLRVRSGRVTLEVRNAALEEVVRSLRRQTWEDIRCVPGATNLITVHLRDVPLEEALTMVSEQADYEWTVYYPLYTSNRSLAEFRNRILTAGPEPGGRGWTNLSLRHAASPAAAFAERVGPSGDTVMLTLTNASPQTAAMALGRFGRAWIIPEDSLAGKVSLRLEAVSFEGAVARLASGLGCRWARCHVLRPYFGRSMNKPKTNSQDKISDQEITGLPPLGAEMVILPFPSDGGVVPPSFPPSGPPPEPETIQRRINDQMREDQRNATPEQRAERWRRTKNGPPTGLNKP